MSSNHSEHTSSNKSHSIEGFLPPRRSKHSRDDENQPAEEGIEKPRRFPFIQIWLYTFIAIIASFLLFYFWQQYNEKQPSSTESSVDLVDNVDQQDQGSSTEPLEEDVSIEDNGDINIDEELDDDKEDLSDSKQENKDASEGQDQDTEDQDQAEEEQDHAEEEPTKGSVITTRHTIQSGETMYSISRKYYGSQDYVNYLAEFNQINDIREIKSGMELKIPEKP